MGGEEVPKAIPEDGTTVFVVDDDASARRALGRRIRSVGLSVKTFAGAQDFLDYQRPPGSACLVLDVFMPGMSGIELQRQLADTDRDLPVVFITGNPTPSLRKRCLEAGAFDFLDKFLDKLASDGLLLSAIFRAIDYDRRTNSNCLAPGRE